MNELGVIYNSTGGNGHSTPAATAAPVADTDQEGDPALVSTEGTVDGGKFRFQAAHIEWLLRFGQPLGLTFADVGKRRHGTSSTLRFCDELFRLYGSEDYNEAMGAAFAVENWAAAGFWKELISGLSRIKKDKLPALPLAFFTWHDKIEEQHKGHVWDELRECYQAPNFSEGPFIRAGVTMLDGSRCSGTVSITIGITTRGISEKRRSGPPSLVFDHRGTYTSAIELRPFPTRSARGEASGAGPPRLHSGSP